MYHILRRPRGEVGLLMAETWCHSYSFADLLWNNAAALKRGRRRGRRRGSFSGGFTPPLCSSGFYFLDTKNSFLCGSLLCQLRLMISVFRRKLRFLFCSFCLFVFCPVRRLFSESCSLFSLPGVTDPSVFDRRHS